jgi:dipeptide/tripeptide permease
MKSVVQAGWLLTTAVGDVIVVAVASVHLMAQVQYHCFT